MSYDVDYNDLEWDKEDEPVKEQRIKSLHTLQKINVTVTKTADGRQDYIQILSEDAISVNIVLVGEIAVVDHRE